MNIMWQSVLKVLTLVLALAPAAAGSQTYAIFLSEVVRSANAVAIVQVGSTAMHESGSTFDYNIKVERVIDGSVRGGCVTGRAGLKSGKRYIVFLTNDNHSQSRCDNPHIVGWRGPIALEVERLSDVDSRLSDADNVKLDIINLMVPPFPDSFERKQSLEGRDGIEHVTVVGTLVPLTSFIEYILATREEKH